MEDETGPHPENGAKGAAQAWLERWGIHPTPPHPTPRLTQLLPAENPSLCLLLPRPVPASGLALSRD